MAASSVKLFLLFWAEEDTCLTYVNYKIEQYYENGKRKLENLENLFWTNVECMEISVNRFKFRQEMILTWFQVSLTCP